MCLSKKIVFNFLIILLSFFTILNPAAAQDIRLPFSDKNYQSGYLNEKGEIVIPPQFNYADDFYAENRLYRLNHYGGVFHDRVQILEKAQEKNTAIIVKDKKFGYIHRDGSFLFEPQFDIVTPFNCGLAIVKHENEWQLITEQGKKVKSLPIDHYYELNYYRRYSNIDSCTYLMAFRKGNRYGVISSTGEIINDAVFTYDGDSTNVVVFHLSGRSEISGKDCMHIQVKVEADDFEKIIYLDMEGNEVVRLRPRQNKKVSYFKEIKQLENGVYLFSLSNGKYGLLDENYELLVEPIFGGIMPTDSPDLFLVSFGHRFGYVNRKGEYFSFTKWDVLDGNKGW